MAGAATIEKSYQISGGKKLTGTKEDSVGTANGPLIEETVANSSTDFNIVWPVDVSQVKTFWLHSTQDVTVETNDGTTPDNTLALKAGHAYEWVAAAPYDSFLFDTDIETLKVTNASGSSAIVTGTYTYDPTP